MPVFPRAFPRRGEIYWAALPECRGSAQAGHRPVLIVSNDVNNQHAPTVVIAAMTRNVRRPDLAVNVLLPAGRPLQHAGMVLCNQLFTMDKGDLEQYRADLAAGQLHEVGVALAVALALPRP